MLSKTAMALVAGRFAGSWRCRARADHQGENHGFIPVNYPYCQENPSDSKCQENSHPAHTGSTGAMHDHRREQHS